MKMNGTSGGCFDDRAGSRPPTIRQPDSVDVEVGRRVRVERIVRGLSQTEMGERIGVTFQQVQKYESGANRSCKKQIAAPHDDRW